MTEEEIMVEIIEFMKFKNIINEKSAVNKYFIEINVAKRIGKPENFESKIGKSVYEMLRLGILKSIGNEFKVGENRYYLVT